MYDVTTIGSALQDLYVFSKEFSVHADPRKTSGKSEYFEFGTKIELDHAFVGVGGGATNSAYTFKNQGLSIACLARVGNDGVGIEIRSQIKKYGIADLILVDKGSRSGRGIFFLGRSGERTVLVYRGASKEFKPSEIKRSILKNTKWVYITSLGGKISILEKVLNYARASKTKIMINPGKQEINNHKVKLLALLKKTNVLLLNREEASLLTSRAYGNINGIMRRLSECLPNSIALVTDGENGVYATVEKQSIYVIIKKVKAVDMTGAGDAFGAGFLSGYIRSKGNINAALNSGIKNSASVVLVMGAKNGLAKKLKLSSKLNYKFKKIN